MASWSHTRRDCHSQCPSSTPMDISGRANSFTTRESATASDCPTGKDASDFGAQSGDDRSKTRFGRCAVWSHLRGYPSDLFDSHCTHDSSGSIISVPNRISSKPQIQGTYTPTAIVAGPFVGSSCQGADPTCELRSQSGLAQRTLSRCQVASARESSATTRLLPRGDDRV